MTTRPGVGSPPPRASATKGSGDAVCDCCASHSIQTNQDCVFGQWWPSIVESSPPARQGASAQSGPDVEFGVPAVHLEDVTTMELPLLRTATPPCTTTTRIAPAGAGPVTAPVDGHGESGQAGGGASRAPRGCCRWSVVPARVRISQRARSVGPGSPTASTGTPSPLASRAAPGQGSASHPAPALHEFRGDRAHLSRHRLLGRRRADAGRHRPWRRRPPFRCTLSQAPAVIDCPSVWSDPTGRRARTNSKDD